jgi:hypothetical protein
VSANEFDGSVARLHHVLDEMLVSLESERAKDGAASLESASLESASARIQALTSVLASRAPSLRVELLDGVVMRLLLCDYTRALRPLRREARAILGRLDDHARAARAKRRSKRS